ncbi:MAG: hypothetical protein KKH94_05925, partial [Candidatus Omnitrophica bacterium]|nr:hypothetical protein [Candidatus Omnitrophota bacterium]
EYCDLGGSAIMKVWAIADDKGELPIERAYFQLGNGTIESLSPIFVNHDGIVLWDKVTELKDDEHGIYYENVSFWLIPVILFCSSNGFIAIDFKGGRKDFRIKSGPWEIDNRITTGIEKHRKDEINVSVKDDCLKMFLEREFFNFS